MTSPVIFTRAGFVQGARDCVPLLIGTMPFGLVTGIASHAADLSMLEAVLMSGIVYAGSAQLLALAAWTHPAPILAATFAAFVVNLRLALMGPVLAPWLDHLRGWRLWLSLFLMADQNWAQSLKTMNAGGRDAAVLLGSGTAMIIVWRSMTAIGYAVGSYIQPPPGHPLFFAALAIFVSMLVNMWRGPRDIVPWLVAAVVATIVSRLLPGGSWHIVSGALSGSLVGGLREHYRRVAP